MSFEPLKFKFEVINKIAIKPQHKFEVVTFFEVGGRVIIKMILYIQNVK